MKLTRNPKFDHPTLRLLEKCKSLYTLNQVHSQMITTGLILHTFPLSRIILSSSAISLSYGLSIFSLIQNPTIFLYNTLISSVISSKNHTQIAFSLYYRILTHKTLKPNNFTFPSLLKACGSPPWLDHGRALHTHVLKFLEPSNDHFVQAALLNYYSKCGKLNLSRYIFNQISKPDLASWNSILAAYAHNATSSSNFIDNITSENHSLCLQALVLFRELQKTHIRPNELTLVALISVCADLGALSQGSWAHTYIIRNNLKLNIFLGSALIDMYSKCGCLDLAYQLFENLPQRDTLCYNSMIRGFAMHGYADRALDLFNKLKPSGLVADEVTLVVTMSACSHTGFVEEGIKCFESMKEDYGIEPKLEHYGCLVDLLGRAGQLYEAKKMVEAMPMEPNAIIWRCLLGAARNQGDSDVAEVALKHLINLEPQTSGNYVLLSNMYASINMWDNVNEVRKLMKNHGVNKNPGTSLVEINGAVH